MNEIYREHGEKTLNTSTSAPLRTLHPLDNDAPTYFNGGPAAGSAESFDIGHKVSNRHQCGMAPEAIDDGDPLVQNRRQAEWPIFGRVERQRANDERRSQTRNRQNHTITNIQSDGVIGPHNMPQQQSTPSSPNVVRRRDSLLRHQQHSKIVREQVLRAAVRKGQERQFGTTVRVRPASGNAAGQSGCGFGRDSTMPLKLSRKRPASADILGEQDRGVPIRIRLDNDNDSPEAPYDPTTVELTWQQQQQQQLPRERYCIVGRAPAESPCRLSGLGVAAAATVAGGGPQQRLLPPDFSQRPKSAYPRLEEGGFLPGDNNDESSGRNYGKSSSPVGRMRSLSAQALRCSASATFPAATNPQGSGRDGRVRHSLREAGDGGDLTMTREEEEDENDEKEGGKTTRVEEVGNKSPLREGRSSVRTTTEPTTTTTKLCSGRPRADKEIPGGNAGPGGGVEQSDGQKYRLIPSAASAADNDRSRRKQSSINVPAAAPQATVTHLPTDSDGHAAAGTRTRKATKSRRVVARSSPSRSRKGGSPRVGRRSRPNVANRVNARADNGRDGKLYLLDLDTDEKKCQKPVHLEAAGYSIDNDPCLDNGRDGKLYVELDNGRDGKRYLEADNDDEESHGHLVASALSDVATGNDDIMSQVSGTSAGELERRNVETVDESLGQTKVEKSLQLERRAEAAITIQKAIAGAVSRRRPSGDGARGEGTGNATPENNLLHKANDDFQVLAEREGGGAQRNSERESMPEVAGAPLEVRGDCRRVISFIRRNKHRRHWCLFVMNCSNGTCTHCSVQSIRPTVPRTPACSTVTEILDTLATRPEETHQPTAHDTLTPQPTIHKQTNYLQSSNKRRKRRITPHRRWSLPRRSSNSDGGLHVRL